MTITVNHGADEDLASGFVPPIAGCLILSDYLGQQIVQIRGKLEGIRSYDWLDKDNQDEAETLCRAAIDARENGLEDETAFFADAVENVFNFDRALRASVEHGTPEPVLMRDIPKKLIKENLRTGKKTKYRLQFRKFNWSETVPKRAAMKAAEVMASDPPDAFWIAEYERPTRTYDPTIYASYGLWQVEVARWD